MIPDRALNTAARCGDPAASDRDLFRVPAPPRLPRTVLAMALLLLVAVLPACGDDPFLFRWNENPREAVLYSLDRDERNRPSAFEMAQGRRVVLESAAAAGLWDFALDTRDGVLVFLPPRSVGVQSRAGMVEFPNSRYDEVLEAPGDTAAYTTREPLPVRVGSIYVVRTREQPGVFGQSCVFYGKVQPLEVDPVAGTLRFRFDTSPDCNNPSLVPPAG
ncbi:hypothetical protein BH23GEM11_BH23GEM11_02730 [soil metagenome]